MLKEKHVLICVLSKDSDEKECENSSSHIYICVYGNVKNVFGKAVRHACFQLGTYTLF